MKSFFSIFLVIFLSKGCSQGHDLQDVKIVYSANTRGFNKSIEIEKKSFSVVYKINENPVVLELKEEEWKKIGELFSKIDLNTFNDLEGPTMERAYDGKPHADLSIITKQKTYTTKGFDHTIPPAQIKEFVDYINKLTDDAIAVNPMLGSYVVEELLANDVSKKEYFLSIEADKVSGFMGCNMFSGTYEFQENMISFGPMISTKKHCENQMEMEALWFKVSSEISTFKMEDKTILLYDSQNKLVLKATKN